MAREVSTFLNSLRDNLAADYPAATWRLATLETTLADPTGYLIGTIAVDDSEAITAEAVDRMTGAWYVALPLVVSLYFSRAAFPDYALARDFAYTIAAWFRMRAAGSPAQAVSQVGTLIRQATIDQKINDGVDGNALANWLLWQVTVTVPEAILPNFPAIPGAESPGFRQAQGPPQGEEIRIDRFYVSGDPDATDPAQAEQIYP